MNKKRINELIYAVLARELTIGGTAEIKLQREIMTCRRGGELQQIYLTVSQSRDINAAAYLNNMHKDDEDSPPLPDSWEIKASDRP